MPGEERIWGNTEMKGARPFNKKFFRSNPKAQQEEEVSEAAAIVPRLVPRKTRVSRSI